MEVNIHVRNLDDEFLMISKESWQTLMVLLASPMRSEINISDDLGNNVCGPYSIWEVVGMVNEQLLNK